MLQLTLQGQGRPRTAPSSIEMDSYLSMRIGLLKELQDAETLVAMHSSTLKPVHCVELLARLPQLDGGGGNAAPRVRALARCATCM